jgi:hypothetical protein
MGKKTKFIEKYLSQLKNKKVVGLALDTLSEAEFGEPVYGLQFDDGTIAWILCDPEGNGPGHLAIEKAVKQ